MYLHLSINVVRQLCDSQLSVNITKAWAARCFGTVAGMSSKIAVVAEILSSTGAYVLEKRNVAGATKSLQT